MRRVRKNVPAPAWLAVALACVGFGVTVAWAQPANDNFADAEDITGLNGGLFGSVTNDLSSATAEAGEPSHAGFPANATVWYKWTAPQNGEVQLDTLSSPTGADTVLAVYTGNSLSTLRQVAANDDLFPYTQFNTGSTSFGAILFQQPYNGPSGLRFNAKVGTTYYLVVGAKFSGGPIGFGWAYRAAGVFRFATEDAVTTFDPITFQFVTIPIYKAAETESLADDASTFETYYQFGVPGLLVTVTRLAGSSGRMLVDYATEDVTTPLPGDVPAAAGFDYTPVQGTLVFDDYEMTKRIVIPISFFGYGLPQTNRDFAVVLSNARADAAESPNVSPPRIDGAYGLAIVRIVDADIDPVFARNFQLDPTDTNTPPMLPPIFQTTNSLFNFTRVAERTVEDVNGYWRYVRVWVNRSGTNTEGVTLHYRINNFLGFGDLADLDEEDNNLFPLQPGSDYATPLPTDDANGDNEIGIHGTNADFAVVPPANYAFPGGGTLTWGQNDFTSKAITFVVTNDTLTEFNEDWHIFLYRNDNNGNPFLVGTINETDVTILFDDQDPPAGSVDQLHNPDFGASMVPPVLTTPPNQAHPGADSVVYGLVVQPDNKTVIAGDFLSFNATTRNRIARLNLNGSLDTSFNPGSGANDFIGAVSMTPSGQFVIGGGFTSYNGTPRVRVARLSAAGALDNSFSAGDGPDGSVWSVAVQPDGKAIIAGEFTSVAGVARTHVARLNTNGVLDTTFDPGPNGPDGTVWAVALQPDGKVIIGGEFHLIAGQTVGGIARLNADGTLDTTFFPGAGTDGTVYALGRQADGKVVVGGDFSRFDFNPRNNLTRLNTDGSLDLTFDPASSGAEGIVYSITVAGSSLYVGGSFLSYNGTHRLGLVRLFSDGTVDTGFLDTAYNQFAGLHRARFSDPPGVVFSTGVQTDDNVMIAGSFEQVGGGQASSQVRFDPAYPTNLFNVDVWTEPKARDGLRNRRNVARLLGGSTPGPGNLSFTAPSHTANENQSSLSVSLTRNNGTLGFLFANFEVEPGLAQSGVDYIYNAIPPIYLSSWELDLLGFQPSQPNSTTRMHSDGLFGDNFVPIDLYGHNWFSYTPGQLVVTILNDNLVQGDRNTTFRLANPTAADVFYLGGENIPLGGALGLSQTPLTIIDDDKKSGVLGFASVNFVVNENVTNAVITVIRTNGSFGRLDCQCSTVVGGSATAGVDYQTVTRTLTFLNSQTTNQTFTIPITDDSMVEPDETIFLRLSAANGVPLGLTNAVVTIIDNDTPGGKLNFSSAVFSTNENARSAVITVTRNGSSSGTLTAQAAATNGTAIAGVNFVGVTNLLTWPNGDVTPRTLVVPLLDDVAINPDRTVNLRLFNPTLNSSPNPASLGPTATATLTILNDDFSGQVSFSAAAYNANENGGPAIITVVRAGGSAESISVNFATSDFEAFAGSDYGATNGTLNFGPGELSKSFTVPIIDNQLTDGNRRLALTLSGASPPAALGFPNTVFLTLVDDESVNEPPGGLDTVFTPLGMNDAVFALARQSDGELIAGGDFTQANHVPRQRIVRLQALDGSVDLTFQASANGTVRSIVPQADGRILIGGAFTTISGVVRNHVGRVNPNGSLDTSFDPGSGADNPLFAVAESFVNGERKIFVGGGFTVFNGVSRNGIARLNNDGSLDTTFNPGLGAAGVVYAVAAYPTNTTDAGKVLIAGDFTAVNGTTRGRIARLNSDGSVDLSFDPGSGANDAIRALAIQVDGRLLIGGSFTNFNGAALNRFARLNANGPLDATFTPGIGADDTVNAISVQGDTKIVLGGQFTRCNGVTRHRITRLNNDGTADPTINFGNGANDFVSATLAQPDGKIVIGGGFTEYDGTPRQRIARIYGGSIAGSGTLEFTAADYQVAEDGTNALITVRRRGGTSGQTAGASVSVDAVTSDGTATNGVHYLGGAHTLVFPEGEVFQSFLIPVIDDFEINPDRTVNLALDNISPPGSASLGNQPVATLTIVNDDSAITFASATYTANENVAGGAATITLVRSGSTRDPASVDFTTTTNGTATAGADYISVTNTVVFASGEVTKSVMIPIINDTLIEGNETVTMELTNVIGALLLVPNQATLTIVDDDSGPGRIAFASAAYAAAENGGNAVVSLIRTNGRAGQVGVTFYTSDGTANAGIDYVATGFPGLPVSFGDGETNKDIIIPIIDDSFVEGNETFFVTLTNATGGATIVGSNTAPVTIIDNDQGFSFSAPVYVVNESGSSVTLTVLRLGGSNGVASVRYSTADVTANAGADYAGVTNALLTFADGETLKTFTITIFEDTLVDGDETFNAVLSNPSPGMQLLNSTAVVSILDNDAGLAFGPRSYSVSEGGTNVVLTVVRTNANTGNISVSFATSNLTATAGADYTSVASQLTFTNGQASNTITVPITDDTQVEGDEQFIVTLSNPSGGAQIFDATRTATVTILDNDAGVRFSSANYSVSEGGVQALITVLRSGVLTNTFAVNYSTSDGTATNTLDYLTASGTLVFTNGVMSNTFAVTIIDDTLEEGAETVLLSLSSPTGQVSLLNPSAAVLTIIDNDGGSIVPAGTRLTSDPNGNGAIDPNETVTALFALRNVSGTNTANLVATLLATNGVISPSGPQTYGALADGGASVSRPFTFTAIGTNGSIVLATFQVQDGALNLGRVTFPFLLGSATTTFTNPSPITIVDNSPATPYPSSITVTGLVGVVSKVTMTVTNLSHGSPNDIDMLLVGPTGTNTVVMSDAGGGNFITNVTLTFDDEAATSLTSSVITNGTYKPTNFGTADQFPAPAPPSPWGAALSAFNGSNPNGLWSLYIVDDLAIFGGSISRGWNVSITTFGLISAAADLSVTMTAAPDPVVVSSNLTYTIGVTNHGPWPATGIILTNTLPAGATVVATNATQGTFAANGALVWTIGSLAKDSVATATIVVRPGIVGSAVSASSVLPVEADPNLSNNVVTTTTTVSPTTADLALGVVAAPDIVFVSASSSLTYSIAITNLGPATAAGVTVTNKLPLGVSFLSASPAGYTLAGGVVTFTNLGSLGSGTQTGATIVVKPTAAGTITNTTTIGSVVFDPLKGNNTVSVKTVVEFPQITTTRSGSTLVIAWPADANAYTLEYTTSLTPPTVWRPVATAPVRVGNQNTVTLTIGSDNEFFRLRTTGP